jgi:general secretion pathway protein G
MEVKSFTLIELLVVIAIISSLSALLVPNFMSARERARDAQRKSDLKQIQKALEMYKLDQNPPAYPATNFFTDNEDECWTSGGAETPCPAGNIYMNKIPKDPNREDGYYFNNKGNLTYDLCACLENIADPDASDKGNCDASYSCTSEKYYLLNEP